MIYERLGSCLGADTRRPETRLNGAAFVIYMCVCLLYRLALGFGFVSLPNDTSPITWASQLLSHMSAQGGRERVRERE